MGEPMLDVSSSTPNLEDKMREIAPSNPALEVSVSFGRFENDSLSWEKWSSFSPNNKYLEEVEKCATPGSVAQKAAYFEAHYKKIAARKAELLDLEKQMDDVSSRVNDQTFGDLKEFNCENNSVPHVSDCQRSDAVVYPEINLVNEQKVALVDGTSGDAPITEECQGSSVEGVKEEESRTTLDKSEEPVDVTVEEEVGNSMEMENLKELHEKEMEPTAKVREEKEPLIGLKNSHKIAPVNEEKNFSSIEKKSVSSVAAPSPRTKSSSVAKPSPRAKLSSVAAPSPRTKSSSVAKPSPRATSSSVAKPSPRAKSSSVAKPSPSTKPSSVAKPSPSTKSSSVAKSSPITKASPLAKVPQLFTPRLLKPAPTSIPLTSSRSSTKIGNGLSLSRNEVLFTGESKKVVPKSLHMSLSLGPSSSDSTSLTTRRKSLIMEQMGDKDIVRRAFKTFQNNYNQLKFAHEERSPAPKQFSKKLEGNDNAREAKRCPLAKEDKEVEVKTVRQSLSSKATSMPNLCRGQRISKGSRNKEGLKSNEMHS